MSEAQAQVPIKSYAQDEYIGLVYRLMKDRDIVDYLRGSPSLTSQALVKALERPEHDILFALSFLESYGVVRSELRVAGTENPVMQKHYSLADDFGQRMGEMSDAIRSSEMAYLSRHGTPMPPLPKELEEEFLRRLG